jgi:magnesium-protoporphyrin IX monomethyl ester (oxidative) cyclase
MFSAEYVVNEIKYLYDTYDVTFISFYDDLFIADIPRLKKIVALLKEYNLLGKIKFSCSCRANLITPETSELLKKLNVVSVAMGLESGCKNTLKFLKGNTVSVDDNKKAIKLLTDAGIFANAAFIIGSPQETKEEMMETYNFIKKSKLYFFDTYFLTPMPGTPIWEYAKNKGLVSDDMDWERLDKEEMLKIYRKFEKLHWYFMIKNGLTNPFSVDIPRYLINKIIEFTTDLKKSKN